MSTKCESGSLIVEATIVFPVMFLVIFFMIFAGNAYLQKCRVESIISQCAIDGASYCADPQLQQVENGNIPDLGSLEVYPYRFFSSTGVGDVEGEMAELIEQRVSNLSTGLFSNMKPTDLIVQTNYSNGILYATFGVDASYKIKIPVRLLGQKENIHLDVRTHVEMPVSDSVELIRNIDMVWDFMERTGVAEKVENVKDKLENALDKVNDWFDS